MQREARLIAGMSEAGSPTQYELYTYCADYFEHHYQGVFFAPDEAAADIFQNTFIKFWENIEQRRLYVHDGQVRAKNGEPLQGSILTYFMGIAKLKNREWVRQWSADTVGTSNGRTEQTEIADIDLLYGNDDNRMLDIIADLLSQMPARCYEILVKFYFEDKSLDRILEEIPSIESKNALKTKKYKCMEQLRNAAQEIYQRYLNE